MPWSTWIRTVEIEPDLTVADPALLARQVEVLLRTGCRVFHLDVEDQAGLALLESIVSLVHGYEGVLDVHLTADGPAAAAVLGGADSITIDAEAAGADETVGLAREHGCQVGVSFPPSAQPGWLPPAGFVFDLISVAGGDATGSIARVREIASSLPLGMRVQVDGGVDHNTVRALYLAGATLLVAGRAIFDREDLPRTYRRLVQALA